MKNKVILKMTCSLPLTVIWPSCRVGRRRWLFSRNSDDSSIVWITQTPVAVVGVQVLRPSQICVLSVCMNVSRVGT